MHLPYLNELADRFEVAALCDLSEPVAAECGRRYGVRRVHTDWRELLDEQLDAVMILTSGDHAPIAIEAARGGLHVFTEKPMALSHRDGAAMIDAARSSGVRLMVGTMKRYDPAYERLAQLVGELSDLRLVRVTTLESPLEPYVAHYPLISGPGPDARLVAALAAAEERALDVLLGDADEQTRSCYRWNLLDSLIHEINALRGVLGEPDRITSAELNSKCVSINLDFAGVSCHLSWVDLPGIARYRQELAFYSPERRLTLRFPSPFLRSEPTELIVEGGEPGTADSWSRREVVSYQEAFKQELIEFADCIATGREPRTSGQDGLADLRVCEAVVRAHRARAAIPVGGPDTAAAALGAKS
jgi:predicted dehydrogenase